MLCRGDYKELGLLAVSHLTNSKAVPDFSSFNKPGALHKARWLPKWLCAIKIDFLGPPNSSQLPKEIAFASGLLRKLHSVQFSAFHYLARWLSAATSFSAPKMIFCS